MIFTLTLNTYAESPRPGDTIQSGIKDREGAEYRFAAPATVVMVKSYVDTYGQPQRQLYVHLDASTPAGGQPVVATAKASKPIARKVAGRGGRGKKATKP